MRKKPTELKRIEGTLRRDRLNPREPRPPKAGAIMPRRGLPLGVRREYALLMAQLVPMNVVTVSDVAALELIAAAGDEFWRAHRFVTRHGMTYPTKNAAGSVMWRLRPEAGAMADAWRRYSAGLQQFGLTPASRPKVEADDPPRAEDRLQTFLRARPNSSSARFFDRPRAQR